jgi:hypothetical protein
MSRENAKSNSETRVLRSIAARPSVVILRAELSHLTSSAHLTRILARLVKSGRLVRVGQGIYAKTRRNKFTGKPAPAATFEEIAREALRKLGIDVTPGEAARDYNAGRTTQIPVLAAVDTGRRRITRRIQLGSRYLTYERKRVAICRE